MAQAVASGEISGRRGGGGLLGGTSSSAGATLATPSSFGLTVAGRSPGRATRGVNSMKEALGYAEFLKFASDFDLSSSVILSTLEIGDIFLSSIKVSRAGQGRAEKGLERWRRVLIDSVLTSLARCCFSLLASVSPSRRRRWSPTRPSASSRSWSSGRVRALSTPAVPVSCDSTLIVTGHTSSHSARVAPRPLAPSTPFSAALVRCSLVAYTKISDASVLDKVRGLFLYMWRAINKSVPRAVAERRSVTTYAGDLISGAWRGVVGREGARECCVALLRCARLGFDAPPPPLPPPASLSCRRDAL